MSESKAALRKTKAFVAFLDQAESCARALQNESELAAELRTRLLEELHKIKGGAGFFGADDLQHLAGLLEECLKDHAFTKDLLASKATELLDGVKCWRSCG